MRTSDQVDQIVPAMHAAATQAKDVFKEKRNAAMGYRYAGLEDILEATKDALLANGIVTASSVTGHEHCPPIATARGGSMQRIVVHLVTRFMHTSGQWIEVEARGEGTDQGDKSVYKAITGARKYALLSGLNLATTDDPEATNAIDKHGTGGLGAEPVRKPAQEAAARPASNNKPVKGRY